jgi:putative peptide zinc metalloprotease protein
VAAPTLNVTASAFNARPRRASGIQVYRRPDDGAIVLRRNGRYIQLSPRSLEIWNAFDGVLDVRALAQRFGSAGVDATLPIVELVRTLSDCGLIVLESEVCSIPHLPSSDVRGANNPLEAYVTFSPERAVNAAYLALRGFFTPPFGIVCALVAVGGLVGFIATPHVAVAHREPLGFVGFALALAAAMLMHEAGHALTLRHFGGTLSRAGIGWYWFAPTAFVDTSSAHLLARPKRIAVSLAGPAVDLTVAGIAVFAAVFAPHGGFAGWAWTLATAIYTIFLWNLNPLLELDWYYVLTDLLGRPNLRRDSFFLLLERPYSGARSTAASRDRVVFLYGLCAISYAATYIAFVVPAVIRATLVAWLTPILPFTIVVALPAGAAAIAAVALIATTLGAGATARVRGVASP